MGDVGVAPLSPDGGTVHVNCVLRVRRSPSRHSGADSDGTLTACWLRRVCEGAAVGAGRYAPAAHELFAQDGRASVSDAVGDLLDRQVRGLQEFLGAGQTQAPQPGVGVVPVAAVKRRAKERLLITARRASSATGRGSWRFSRAQARTSARRSSSQSSGRGRQGTVPARRRGGRAAPRRGRQRWPWLLRAPASAGAGRDRSPRRLPRP